MNIALTTSQAETLYYALESYMQKAKSTMDDLKDPQPITLQVIGECLKNCMDVQAMVLPHIPPPI